MKQSFISAALLAALLCPMPAFSQAVAPELEMAWTDNSSGETRFEIERRAGSGSFLPLGQVGPNGTNYIDNQTILGTPYTYRVRACNATACSAYSNMSSVVQVIHKFTNEMEPLLFTTP